jgi:hypothetical protein
MVRKFESDHLSADLASVTKILGDLSPESVLGRIGMEARREDILQSLREIEQAHEPLAAAALYFNGAPVVGSVGIEAEFATAAVGKYQDLVAKVLAAREVGNLGQRGPAPGRRAATLHITNVLRGSFGFLLEELNQGEQGPLLDSTLKVAMEDAARLVTSFGNEDEEQFTNVLVNTDRRVFDTASEFFRFVHDRGAVFRLVCGNYDLSLNDRALAIAADRAQLTRLSEEPEDLEGELLGILPEAHRFEFRMMPGGEVIQGAVSGEISTDELRGLYRRVADRRVRAHMLVRQVERPGREPRRSYMLLSAEIDG